MRLGKARQGAKQARESVLSPNLGLLPPGRRFRVSHLFSTRSLSLPFAKLKMKMPVASGK